MGNRFTLYLGAGVVAAGVTVGMLAGAGMAHAQTESDGDGGTKTSQAAKPDAGKPDSDRDGAGQKQPQNQDANDDKNDDDPSAGTDKDTVKQDSGRKSSRPDAGKRTQKLINNFVATVTHKPERKAVVDKTAQAEPVEKVEKKSDPVETIETVETEPVVSRLTQREVDPAPFSLTKSDLTLATPMLGRSESVASAAPPLQVPPVVSAIGTLVFGLISFGESLIEGPPMALPGSGVTVKRSTLVIGDKEVPADWYFPEGSLAEDAPTPERIIYLQHGFLARGVFYDYTASYLAKETNSIVVAPSLTSNIFATDGMWLGGEQMHRAVADLFLDNNDVLIDSAILAGYPEAKEEDFPQQVVLVGHSLGGGLVADTAGYMVDNGTSHKLAGVVMLDGVGFNDEVSRGLDKLDTLPADEAIPLYNLSATPYFWNLFGSSDAILEEKRPNMFTGVQLLGGLHSDSMIGGNPLVQSGAYLLTGYGGPQNVEGTQVLAAGWINDMFACHDDPNCTPDPDLYGPPGSTITIPTSVGTARGLVRPEPGVVASAARQLTAVFFGLLGNIDFATQAPDIEQAGVLQEIST